MIFTKIVKGEPKNCHCDWIVTLTVVIVTDMDCIQFRIHATSFDSSSFGRPLPPSIADVICTSFLSYCDDGTCLSGSPDCDLNLSPCGFRADGVFYPNSIVVNATTDIDVISGGSCGTILAVAVGGGGTTDVDAGSGSGYVEFAEISPPSSVQFRAEVGGAQEVTQLTDMSDGRGAIQ